MILGGAFEQERFWPKRGGRAGHFDMCVETIDPEIGRIWFHNYVKTLLRGTIVNRTYGTHKNQYFPILTNNIWSYLLWSPVIIYRYVESGGISTCFAFFATKIYCISEQSCLLSSRLLPSLLPSRLLRAVRTKKKCFAR